MKENITILTGAGLTAGKDFFGITTSGLTKDFVAYNHSDLTDDKEFMFFIYSEFCFWNKLFLNICPCQNGYLKNS